MLKLARPPDALQTVAERRLAGQVLRRTVPRSLHATWTAPAKRLDPVRFLLASERHSIAALLPIRHARMRTSPFAFMRGSAGLMAADLAGTPSPGLRVQACGDAHHDNFGVIASPEGAALFDVNDFDETLPAPFEWDIKRLAVGFALDADTRGLGPKVARLLARSAALAYRTHILALARMSPLEAWRSSIDAVETVEAIGDPRVRERDQRAMSIAAEAARLGYPKLLERRNGRLAFRDKPPLIVPLLRAADDTHALAARTAFDSYRRTLRHECRILLDRYRLVDVAFKVVGIGSVGTFCAVGLFVTADDEPLLLQVKEAQASALAPFAGASAFSNAGERVVTGQQIMQATPDIFLGWTQDPGDDLHCYVRRLKDPRLSRVAEKVADASLPHHAALCGRALARAHARGGDAAMIAGYMGTGGVFDAAIADFAIAYAEQVRQDFAAFTAAIDDGLIEARGT